MVSAAVAEICAFVWVTWGLIPWIFKTPANPGMVFTRSENIGNLIMVCTVFCATSPFVLAASYLGIRASERLVRGPGERVSKEAEVN